MKDFRAERILEWRESIATLPDSQFFELVRMYLGGFSSPFNKQKLIEDLSAFLRNDENKKIIASLLSETDLKIIAAVCCINEASVEKIAQFFDGTISFVEISERVSNLEERLILFRKKREDAKTELCINPHLDDIFDKDALRGVLLQEGNVVRLNQKSNFRLSPEFLSAFISFVNLNPDLCKCDGTFKKRILGEIKNVFGEIGDEIFLLKNAFENLGIIVCSEDGKHSVAREKLIAFSKLPQTVQKAYICATAQARLSRAALCAEARILIQSAISIPAGGFSRSVLIRLAWLLSADDGTQKKSRFSKMLEKYSAPSPTFQTETLTSGLSRLIDSAIRLGFFRIRGIEEDGTDIFEASEEIFDGLETHENETAKVLSIDAAFTVMLFPGLSLFKLVSLLDFLEIRKFDTALTFEITKKSVMKSFDLSIFEDEITRLLETFCMHALPQNLLVQLEDWRKAYGNATLYSGFVLRVLNDDAGFSLKNPKFAEHVVETLAPGVFLLDVSSEAEARKIVSNFGSDFVGKTHSAQKTREIADFPEIFVERKKESPIFQNSIPKISSEEERKSHFEKLRSALEKMTLSKEEKECLLFRINRKIILTEKQLKSESVKFSRLEASGMDFLGKVHIIEQSMNEKIPVEMTFSAPPPNGAVVIGLPLLIEKNENDVFVTVRPAGTNVEQRFSVSQANRVRQIYSSKF